MEYLTAEEEYELQYADDLDVLSELEHLQASGIQSLNNTEKNYSDEFATPHLSLPRHNIVSSLPSSAIKRPMSSEESCIGENVGNKRLKLSIKPCDNVEKENSCSKEVEPTRSEVCPKQRSIFSLPVTRFDGSRGYLALNDDACDLQITFNSYSDGLLETPIEDLKLKAFQKLDTQKQANDVTLANFCKSDASCKKQKELWVEKYKPRSFTELLSDEGINRILLRWLKLWDKIVFSREKSHVKFKPTVERKTDSKFPKALPALSENLDEHGRPAQKVVLMCGAPGLGKTTLANVIASFAGYNVVELNASDDRSPDVFRRCLEAATQMKAVLDKHNRPNCLIIDEIDGAPPASINVLVSFIKSVGQSKKNQKKGAVPLLLRPIICICNDQYVAALKPLRQISLILNFPPTSKHRLADRLYEIAAAEGFKTDRTPLIALCEKVNNDIRSCLSFIQFLLIDKKSLNLSDLKTLKNGVKDVHKTLFNVWREVFCPPKDYVFNELVQCVQGFGDYEKIFNGIYENYIKLKLKAAQERNLWKGADWLCFSDILQQEIYQHQFFYMMSYLPFVAVAFHELYANAWYQRLSYPTSYFEFVSTKAKLSSCLASLIAEITMSLKCFIKRNALVLDLIPMLIEIVKPSLRGLNPQLFSDQEKSELKRVVDVMISFNLSYAQERTNDGDYKYVLEPNLEELVYFSTPQQRKELSYGTRQLISREVSLEKIRREAKLRKPAVNEDESKVQPVKKFCPHLFGIKAEVPKKDASMPSKAYGPKDDVWFYFKEGFSSAVKRTVHIKNVL